jgi:hypothetical protein
MKTTAILIGAAALAVSVIIGQAAYIRTVKSERDTYRRNQDVLMSEATHYRVSDSLNAVTVAALTLTVSELEKYRAADAGIIADLRVDRKRLEGVVSITMETNRALEAQLTEKIVFYPDNDAAIIDTVIRMDTLRCLDVEDEWVSLHGCASADGLFNGSYKNRESLKLIEHSSRKRFLGFLWYYGEKVDRRELVSLNPYTEITEFEYIKISK